MMKIISIKGRRLPDSCETAPDKSITHRAVMFNCVASPASFGAGGCVIKNPLLGEDCLSTVDCMRALGAEIEVRENEIRILKPVDTKGIAGKSFNLYAGNSGTTIRLLCGLLSGLGVYAELSGDASVAKRPMERVAAPLREMGAAVRTTDGRPPVFISPSSLCGREITMNTPSAQVKSALILAGLNACGPTVIQESAITRDHTELMLKSMGADLTVKAGGEGNEITVKHSVLKAADIEVGGDISSAAYWLVLGAVIPGAKITLRNVNINPTRTGILTIMRQAGCRIALSNVRETGGEPAADITSEYTPSLKPFEISGAIVPLLIDEIPVLAVLACFIKGVSVIKNAAELRVKESDRIAVMAENLAAMGAKVTIGADGMTVDGSGGLAGTQSVIKTYGDHRIAMSMAVAALASEGGAEIDGIECSAVSFPGFISELMKITDYDNGVAGAGGKEYALIGGDIGYSASAAIHNSIYDSLKINARYRIIDADAEFLENVRENMKGFSGFNVTKPYKTRIIPYLDGLDAFAAACGAVNTVVRENGGLKGYNTDGQGFLDSLKYHGIKLKDKRILVLGAGGAARAVIAAINRSRCKYAHMSVYNRTAAAANSLKAGLGFGALEVLESIPQGFKADIVINCTTAGQHGDICALPPHFDYAQLYCCIDLIYNPGETALLKNAAAHGVKTVNGAAMLAFQAVRAERLWQGDITLTKKTLNDIIREI